MSQFVSKSDKDIASQLIIPRADLDNFFESPKYRDELYRLTENGVGGFCVFGGNLEKLNDMVGQLQGRCDIPLIFLADFEYGLSMRLDDGTEFPHAMALGKGDEQSTFEVASAIARESKAAGVDWVLAPVCDINNNPLNPVINIRSFGETAEVVQKHAVSYIKGLQANKVAACAKHFPGHGNTDIDSHISLPVINSMLADLENNELKPFLSAIDTGVKSIMTGHLDVPIMDKDKTPASLSKNIVGDYLGKMMKYKGLRITDALDMKAITSLYSSGRATELAFRAGNDIALMPENPLEAIDQMTALMERDNELRESLVASADKLYNLKRWCGLIPQFARPEGKLQTFMEHQKIALKAAYEAVEVVEQRKMVPIDDTQNIAGFAILQRSEDLRAATRFFTMFAQALDGNCDFAYIDENITDENIEDFLDKINHAEMLVFPIFIKGRAFHGSVDISDRLTHIIEKLAAGRPKIIILHGSPYLKDKLPADCHILAYSDSFPSMAASIMKMTGRGLPDDRLAGKI